MSATVVIFLFGVSCPAPCPVKPFDLRSIEKEVTTELTARGATVKPPPADARRPTGTTASTEETDEAALLGVDRLVALDFEAGAKVLWITHFVRGGHGPWSIGKVACRQGEGGVWECPGIEQVVVSGLRPRTARDVDITAALRRQASAVSECVREEDRVPPAERIFGRIEMDLLAEPNGEVRVVSIAPVVASRSNLGDCLRRAMGAINVGQFDGQAISFRVPVDL